MALVDRMSWQEVAKLFPKKAGGNVQLHWPLVQSRLRTQGLGDEKEIVLYTIATIKAETGDFSTRSEGKSAASSTPSGRPFGQYDELSLEKDGKLKFDKQGLPAMRSSTGNKPYLGGTPLDPQVSGENQWRNLKGLPERQVEDLAEGERFRGRGFIQLTGRARYEAATKFLKEKRVDIDLVAHPEKAGEPGTAAAILVWYLSDRKYRIKKCLSTDPPDFLEARAVVNGKKKDGTVHGLPTFREAYKAASALLEVLTQPPIRAPKGGPRLVPSPF